LQQNRSNALKSTGPKDAGGKARSSRNAEKHGLLSASPVISGLESRKAWEEHRAGLFESWAPVGYQESHLVLRLATISWEQSRITRCLANVAAASIAAAESDMEESAEPGCDKPEDPEEALKTMAKESRIIDILEALPKMTEGEKIDQEIGVGVLAALVEETSLRLEMDIRKSVPGIPDDPAELGDFDNWTVGLLWKTIEVYARATQVTKEYEREQTIDLAIDKHDAALREAIKLQKRGKRWKLRLDVEKTRRMLPDPAMLNALTRREAHLDRSYFKYHHELQRLQASRLGAAVPPPAALDVDVTIHSEGPREGREIDFELAKEEIAKRTHLSSLETGSSNFKEKECTTSGGPNEPMAVVPPPIADGGTNPTSTRDWTSDLPPGWPRNGAGQPKFTNLLMPEKNKDGA
jgi:hypothetical protein